MKKYILISATCLVLGSALFLGGYLLPLTRSMNDTGMALSIYIDADDTADSVALKVRAPRGWQLMHCVLRANFGSGHYTIEPGMDAVTLYRKLRGRMQTPVRVTIPQVRTMDQLAGYLAQRIMADSTELVRTFLDSVACARYGVTPETLPTLFIPDTYELWWNLPVDRFLQRMQRECRTFWTQERLSLARQAGLTPEEVYTLASIVAEETTCRAEMPMVASVYINRLRMGMPLQACPTVKFALRDFSLRRILLHHLDAPGPYNTYRNTGLPPGPIRITAPHIIDAVLHFDNSGYLYMCAKEDFSGTHNFARTYAEHLANARRYTRALNARGVK